MITWSGKHTDLPAQLSPLCEASCSLPLPACPVPEFLHLRLHHSVLELESMGEGAGLDGSTLYQGAAFHNGKRMDFGGSCGEIWACLKPRPTNSQSASPSFPSIEWGISTISPDR